MSRNNFPNKGVSGPGQPGKLKLTLPGKRLIENSEVQLGDFKEGTVNLNLPRINTWNKLDFEY